MSSIVGEKDFKKMKKLITTIVVLLSLVIAVSSTGKFFVGLLNYDNTGNLDLTGNCCDGNLTGQGGTCVEFCDLIFEITVTGLDRSPYTRELSNKPVSDKSVISFSSSYEGINPLSFNFTRWPDEVNITVNVYDQDGGGTKTPVDQFHAAFAHQGSDHFYILKPLKGLRPTKASSLTVLFRYMCDKTLGPSCFTDCMDHGDDEVCPSPLPPSGTDITISNPFCDQPDNQSSSSGNNCSAYHITTDPSPETSTLNQTVSTKRVYLDSGSTLENQTTKSSQSVSNTSDNETKSYSGSSTVSTQSLKTSETSFSSSISSNSFVKTTTSTKSTSISFRVQETIPGTHSTNPTPGTPPPDSYVYVDNGMDYWPAIVGGVLGGIALLAAAGFLLYYKRQKKLQKRQEIYNVNPKILRQFEEYAENGTSGRADVPLETEQV